MNRTLSSIGIFGLVTAAIVTGYILLKDRVTLLPKIGSVPMSAKVQSHMVSTPRLKQKQFQKGANHENGTHRNRSTKVQGAGSREDQRSSDEFDEIESIASIYQDEEGLSHGEPIDPRGTSKIVSAVTAKEDAPSSTQEMRSSRPIPGVKIAAWVSSQKNAVPKEVPDPNVGTGMRYFLNCLELKNKGLLPLDAKDCNALLADRRLK